MGDLLIRLGCIVMLMIGGRLATKAIRQHDFNNAEKTLAFCVQALPALQAAFALSREHKKRPALS